jgi:hypothetical protein
MSDFKVINTHNTLSYTKYNYAQDIPDLRRATRLEQEELVTTLNTKQFKEWEIIIDGIEKNIESHRAKGEYIAIAPTVIIYDEAGMGVEKERRAVTAKEWKEKYYPEILDRFKNGVTINGMVIMKPNYRPDMIEAIDGGKGWIHAVYSESTSKVEKEAHAVILDREYVTADGLDPAKEKEKRIKNEKGELQKVKELFDGESRGKKSSVQVTADADYAERGYTNEAKHRKRLKEEKEKGGAVSN